MARGRKRGALTWKRGGCSKKGRFRPLENNGYCIIESLLYFGLVGYEVSISTSDKAGASTLHNITIVLFDESGSKSPPLLIENSSHDKLLSRGETHTSTLQSNVALGKLKSLLVAMVRRKGVKGEDDALKWHLERITVKDLQNDQRYI